jgi:cytochrome c553
MKLLKEALNAPGRHHENIKCECFELLCVTKIKRLIFRTAIFRLFERSIAVGTSFLIIVIAAHRVCARDLRQGGQSYAAHCARCHGATGTDAPQLRSGPAARSLADCAWMQMMSDATLFGIIRNGGRWAGMRDMPAIDSSVSDQEIREIIAFIRTFCAQDRP